MAKSKRRKSKLKRLFITLVILIIIFIVLCFLTPSEPESQMTASGEIAGLELPMPIPGEQIIKHTGYTLSYNEEFEVPSYVAYELTRDEVLGGEERSDSFKADPTVRTGSAELDDYRGSGYDRGHMAPAADFKWSEEAMKDTFYLSNMCPQDTSFNRGIWADLEAVIRTMAYDNDRIYVVTGPVLTDGPYETIGDNEVAVPKNFYKVVLDYTDPGIKAIGFILPNENSDRSLQSFAVTVDEVEEMTGIDFYPALPDDEEEVLESQIDITDWNFSQFMPTGEAPSQAQVDYVSPDAPLADKVLDAAISVFIEIKTEFFRSLGISDLAKSIGLL